ncbi:MAG: hypothetical protein Q9181_001623 [Wetmoreana brouardii]
MALGLRLLWNLHIDCKEKLALGAIFSVGLIKITFAVIRVVKIGATARHVNPIWLALWSMIEASVAVVVACLPSFRVLFAHGRRQSEVRHGVTLKRFRHHRPPSQSNDLAQPLENGGWRHSGSTGAQPTNAEEAQEQGMYMSEGLMSEPSRPK